MNTGDMLFLNEERVRQHLRIEELISAMEKALVDFSAVKLTSTSSFGVARAAEVLGAWAETDETRGHLSEKWKPLQQTNDKRQ